MALPPRRVVLAGALASCGVLLGGIAAASRSISLTVATSSKVTRRLAHEAEPILARQRGGNGRGPAPASGPVHPEVWLVVLEAAIFAAALVLLGAIVVPALRRWRQDRRARRAGLAAADPPPGELAEGEERVRLGDEVATALNVLDDEQDARAAVIVCWSRLEEAVAACGAPRHAAETSEELTRRVLGAYTVDATALRALHGTYRLARFSSIALEPDARDSARRALLGLRDALASPR